MPSVSDKQHNAMEAAARGHSTLGIPKSVGQDFVAADKAKKDHYAPSPTHNPHTQHHTIDAHHNKTDDHGHKGAHEHDHVTLHNAHPHAHPTHHHISQTHNDIPPHKKSFNRGVNAIIDGLPIGQYKHHIHDRRDKGPEHHPPSGLMHTESNDAEMSGHPVNGGY